MIEQSGIWTYCYTGETRSHGTHVVQTFVALEEVDEGLAEQVEKTYDIRNLLLEDSW